MKNTSIAFIVASLALMASVNATTVGFSPAPSARTLVSSAGATLASSSLVLAGNFLNESFAVNASLNARQNFDAIVASGVWEEFGKDTLTGSSNTGVTGALTVSALGKLGGAITDNNTGATKADYFNGKSLYVWVFNAATIDASTQMGIFKSIPPTTSLWAFPTNANGIGDSNTFSTITSLATVASVGIVPVGSVNALGSFGQMALVPIPEPSSSLLAAFGLMIISSNRRRRVRTCTLS